MNKKSGNKCELIRSNPLIPSLILIYNLLTEIDIVLYLLACLMASLNKARCTIITSLTKIQLY